MSVLTETEVIEAEEKLLAILKPCPDDALRIWAVNKMIGNVRNKGPQLAMAL